MSEEIVFEIKQYLSDNNVSLKEGERLVGFKVCPVSPVEIGVVNCDIRHVQLLTGLRARVFMANRELIFHDPEK